MTNPSIINYHIIRTCNCNCLYCFGKFYGRNYLNLEEAKRVVDSIKTYFKDSKISNGRINLAGGEPTEYPYLDDLIVYIHNQGIQVSIITNGFHLTKERIQSWKGLVSTIGISIDAITPKVVQDIGRCPKNREPLPLAHWEEIGQTIHESGIKLKIDTVVSKLNLQEDLTSFYQAVKPDRLKLLQMHLIEGINNHASSSTITEEEFSNYCKQYESLPFQIVKEPSGSMENSYLMINPQGDVQLNDGGTYRIYGNCITQSFTEIIKELPFDNTKFSNRYQKEATV